MNVKENSPRASSENEDLRNVVELQISGMTCAACVNSVRNALREVVAAPNATTGIQPRTKVNVSLMNGKAEIASSDKIDVQSLIAKAKSIGYGAAETNEYESASNEGFINVNVISHSAKTNESYADAQSNDAQLIKAQVGNAQVVNSSANFEKYESNSGNRSGNSENGRITWLEVVIACYLAVLVLIASMTSIRPPHWMILSLVSTAFVMWLSRDMLRRGFLSIKVKSLSMYSLVAVGSTIAFVQSSFGVLQSHEHLVMFESAAVVLAAVLLGKKIEETSKYAAQGSLKHLLEIENGRARVEGSDELVRIKDLNLGARVVVRGGETVPIDGVVVDGAADMDTSMFTGEATPRRFIVGDRVSAGMSCVTGHLAIEMDTTVQKLLATQIRKAIERSQFEKSNAQTLVDKISELFLPFVVLLSIVTFIGWVITGHGFSESLTPAVAVLVVTCPCALGLAIPMAIVVATNAGARKGLLFRTSRVIELAQSLDTIVFDKTGTLTTGRLKILSCDLDDEMLSIAAGLEQVSTHPIAAALRREIRRHDIQAANVLDITLVDRGGVQGVFEGVRYKLVPSGAGDKIRVSLFGFDESIIQPGGALDSGSRNRELNGSTGDVSDAPSFGPVNGVPSGSTDGDSDESMGQEIGTITFEDPLRTEAKSTIEQIVSLGIKPVILSGDRQKLVEDVAAQVGVAEYYAQVSPIDKERIIGEIQSRAERVAMVGDGLNDAAALSKANIGIAVSSSADVASASADVVLLDPSIQRCADAVLLAQKTQKIIRQNLMWAFSYNAVMIPLAVFGIASPAIAGLAMAVSSVAVVLNSLRAR